MWLYSRVYFADWGLPSLGGLLFSFLRFVFVFFSSLIFTPLFLFLFFVSFFSLAFPVIILFGLLRLRPLLFRLPPFILRPLLHCCPPFFLLSLHKFCISSLFLLFFTSLISSSSSHLFYPYPSPLLAFPFFFYISPPKSSSPPTLSPFFILLLLFLAHIYLLRFSQPPNLDASLSLFQYFMRGRPKRRTMHAYRVEGKREQALAQNTDIVFIISHTQRTPNLLRFENRLRSEHGPISTPLRCSAIDKKGSRLH